MTIEEKEEKSPLGCTAEEIRASLSTRKIMNGDDLKKK